MTKYIKRLAKDVFPENYKITVRIISIYLPVREDIYGIYFKVKRGHNRMLGKNRYAVYTNSKHVEIDEIFEQTSTFFKNHHTKRYQKKNVNIDTDHSCR